MNVIYFILKPEEVRAALSEDQFISLTEDENNYIIENEYYKAFIPKANASTSRGIIHHLYIKKDNSQWSNNLVKEGINTYGLGYLEGSGLANLSGGCVLSDSNNIVLSILENTSTTIRIRARDDNCYGTDYIIDWTFWAKKPYFRSEASAVVIDEDGFLTNQFQFCWMINNNLTTKWYGTDKDGNIAQFTSMKIQQIHSPKLNTFPWINWQFTDDNVSLGLIFSDIYDYYGTVAETGDWKFEYQLDFELGSGVLSSPITKGYRRAATTIYYTADHATNETINNFAQNHYQYASTSIKQNPILQAAQYVNDPYYQNSGLGSALVNSPYFLVRQNTQNMHYGDKRHQYETSIYAPLYKAQKTIHSGGYDFEDQLIYSLNYSDASTTYEYATITNIIASNSDYETSLQMQGTANEEVSYNTTFKTWNDSDKLKIEGSVSNATSSASIKDIYVSLKKPDYTSLFFECEDIESPYITLSLINDDGLWTKWDNTDDSGRTLMYYDNKETVPALAIPLPIPDGEYNIKAYVRKRTEGNIIYRYSFDNSTWNSFTVPIAASVGTHIQNLGVGTITSGVFYIDDDDSASFGANGWAGWDRLGFQPIIHNLSFNTYNVRLYDDIYGEIGIAVKVNSPTDNISIVNNSDMHEIRIYLYQEDTAQPLTDFDYPFDIEIWPHKGWLSDASEFTSLHSQDKLTYTRHAFYVPDRIHTGITNTIYANGVISYSTEPYNSSSEINMVVTPSSGSVDVAINTWNTSGTYYKKWTETATGTLSVAHTVGDLKTDTYYTVKVDGTRYNTYLSDDSGEISFTYTGAYSDHIFEVEEDTAPSASFDLSSPYDNTSTHDTTPTFSWNASTDPESGLAKYQLYIDGILDRDDISSSTTSITPSQSLPCGSHTWYVKAVDNAGNSIRSNSTFTVNIVCGFTQGQPITKKPISTMTVAEIRAKITEITEAIFQLKLLLSEAEKTKKTYEGIPSDLTFDKNLQYGQISEEVEFLQIILKHEVGPPTYPENVPATGWFGPITKSSVIKFQEKYASDILAPWNLTEGTGFVGRTTRVKFNELINQ